MPLKMRILWGILLLAGPVNAQVLTGPVDYLTMRPGFIARWKAPAVIKDVAIGDDTVANAVPANDMTLVITAKAVGSTNFIVFGQSGEVLSNLIIAVTPRELNKIIIHNKIGNLQGYTAYTCSPICARIDDKLEGSDRVPPPPNIVVVAPPVVVPPPR